MPPWAQDGQPRGPASVSSLALTASSRLTSLRGPSASEAPEAPTSPGQRAYTSGGARSLGRVRYNVTITLP